MLMPFEDANVLHLRTLQPCNGALYIYSTMTQFSAR